MNVFDCHLHVEEGLDGYPLTLASGNIIFNTVASYQRLAVHYPTYSHSLVFDYRDQWDFVAESVLSGKVRALKIHSRLQKISDADYDHLLDKLKMLNSNIPIIYDAFYYGHDLVHQPNLTRLVQLATSLPGTRFIIAHAGGHHALDYFFHLRDLKNVGFDLSFSLQYLENTSAFLDLEKLVRHTDRRRLFWGSDYPFASPSQQLETLTKMLSRLNFTDLEMEGVFNKNWMDFTER